MRFLIGVLVLVMAAEASAAWGVFRQRTVVRYRGPVTQCPNGKCGETPTLAPKKPDNSQERDGVLPLKGDGSLPLAGDGTLPLRGDGTWPVSEAQKWADYKVKVIVRRGGLFHPRGWGGRFEGVGSCSGGQIPTCTPCGNKWCEGCHRCGKPRGDAKAYSVRTRQWYRVRIW